jgi:hypothetical protein
VRLLSYEVKQPLLWSKTTYLKIENSAQAAFRFSPILYRPPPLRPRQAKKKKTYIINSLGWQTVVATPPTVHQGFMTVWPPVTEQPASRAQSLKPLIIWKEQWKSA